MARKELPKVTEPSTGLIHYDSAPIMDAVTLCGKTDWLGEQIGEATDQVVTCASCQSIVDHIHAHRKP